MKYFNNLVTLITITISCYCLPANSAVFNIDDNASVVYLRTTCQEGSYPQVNITNCFDTMSDLRGWLSTRKPSSANKLLVEIGPGTFKRLSLVCDNWGHTTFKGAGRGATVIKGGIFTGCTDLNFNHLTIISKFSAAVTWLSNGVSGKSNWNDVELIGNSYGWYEENSGTFCSDGIKGSSGKHYWNNSKITAQGSSSTAYRLAYRDACGSENWFFGSELFAEATANQNVAEISGIVQDGQGDTHIYGSVIRAISSTIISANSGIFCGIETSRPLISAACINNGSIHIHGTGIDVLSMAVNNDIVALVANTGSHIHANNVAYNLDGGIEGSITRILNNGGTVKAPYAWEASSSPPNIISIDGADSAIITNTSSTPQFVIYSATCASKWFDVGINNCLP